jgi:hypothetical protein
MIVPFSESVIDEGVIECSVLARSEKQGRRWGLRNRILAITARK